MAREGGGPATLTASFVPEYFGRLKREEETKIPLLSCTESLSYRRLNKYPGQVRQNFVNPLKACKIKVECGCFPVRLFVVMLFFWVRWELAAAFHGGSGVFLLLLWSCPGPQNPRERMWGAGCGRAGLAHRACPYAPIPAGSQHLCTLREQFEIRSKLLWQIQLTRYLKAPHPLFFLFYCLGILGSTQLYSFLFLSENQTMILVSHFKVDFESLVSSIPSHFSVSYVLF